jgi:dCMP deaminase
MNKSWKKWHLGLANYVAGKSKDRSTKVGAVIVDDDNTVIATGFNSFPRGVNDDIDERHERPAKYKWTEHAERNAIYNAARQVLKGTTLVLQYPPCPCHDCTRGVIQSGIKKIIVPKTAAFPGVGDWDESLAIAREMLEEAGIEIEEVEFDEDEHDFGDFHDARKK